MTASIGTDSNDWGRGYLEGECQVPLEKDPPPRPRAAQSANRRQGKTEESVEGVGRATATLWTPEGWLLIRDTPIALSRKDSSAPAAVIELTKLK